MIETVTPEKAAELITNPDVDVVDVRDAEEWSGGHIPHARPVPLDRLRADPDTLSRGRKIMFVCAKGVRSLTAAKLAERLGLSDLYNLEGGTAGWVRAGLPLVVG